MLPAWCSDARLALWICLGLWLLRFGRLQVPLFLVIFHTLICLASLICSVTFYVHTTRTVFNRRAPLAFMPWWRHFMMTRPLEVLWRFLTVPLRVQPDLLILGEVRTGTTSLAAYLRALGCVGAFSPWIHPLASDKESFYFVGHYWGMVHPDAYRMCFPLKIWIWWRVLWCQERPLVFDACASHLTAPAAPALLYHACPKAALLVLVRPPELQHKSWWRLESNAIAWGRSMGMGEDFLLEGYPPKTLPEAVAWSRKAEVQEWYQEAEAEAMKVLDSGQGCCAALTSRRLPEKFLPFPGGQLLAFARMGNYAQNIRRYLRFWTAQRLVIAKTEELTEQFAPVEMTEVRIGLVKPNFFDEVLNFENRVKPVLEAVGRVAEDRNLAESDDIADAFNCASVGGKLVWYDIQNLVPEPGRDLFKELPNAISALGMEDAKELVSAPELEGKFGTTLLEFCLKEGERRGYARAYNLARLYSVVPRPASTHDCAEESLNMILAKGGKFESKDEQERVIRNYLLAAVSSQKELKAAYMKTNQPLRPPSEYDFNTHQWVKREHWAADLPLWTLLTDAERQAARENDFTVNEVPADAAEVYWATTHSQRVRCMSQIKALSG
ncbi:Hypothetical protein SCF082_LOCUS44941 [Durusdinium trenchii]|uniref:Sulfotransferase n=1 Tax=Durusdinium trenchii TaxID=1381693 RepID=A0ABP0R537_9DINO